MRRFPIAGFGTPGDPAKWPGLVESCYQVLRGCMSAPGFQWPETCGSPSGPPRPRGRLEALTSSRSGHRVVGQCETKLSNLLFRAFSNVIERSLLSVNNRVGNRRRGVRRNGVTDALPPIGVRQPVQFELFLRVIPLRACLVPVAFLPDGLRLRHRRPAAQPGWMRSHAPRPDTWGPSSFELRTAARLPVSNDALLRVFRRRDTPASALPQGIGIDDWTGSAFIATAR